MSVSQVTIYLDFRPLVSLLLMHSVAECLLLQNCITLVPFLKTHAESAQKPAHLALGAPFIYDMGLT